MAHADVAGRAILMVSMLLTTACTCWPFMPTYGDLLSRHRLVAGDVDFKRWRSAAGGDPAEVALVRLPMVEAVVHEFERRRPTESEVLTLLGPNEDDYFSYLHSVAYVLDAPVECGSDTVYRFRLTFDDAGNLHSMQPRCEDTLWRRSDAVSDAPR